MEKFTRKNFVHYLKNEAATQAFAQALAPCCQPPLQIHLSGELGSGKTTLVRALLRSLGISGAIKSPSYSLVEPYHLKALDIYHVDLYRLSHPEELEFIGWRDYQSEQAFFLIEWPQKAAGFLPAADLDCQLDVLAEGRMLKLEAKSDKGVNIITKIQKFFLEED